MLDYHDYHNYFNCFQGGAIWECPQMGGGGCKKTPLIQNLPCIFHNGESWFSYTIKSKQYTNHLKHLLNSAKMASAFFTRNLGLSVLGNKNKNSQIQYIIHYFF